MNIAKMLMQHTCEMSGWDEHRPYIGLSQLHKNVEDITRNFFSPQKATEMQLLKCYKGYQMERDILDRMERTFPASIFQRGPIDLSYGTFNTRVEGHADFRWSGQIGEVKSVPLDEHLPQDRLPFRVYYQVQAYLLADGTDKAIVLYESRESGLIKTFIIPANRNLHLQIRHKILKVIDSIE